MIWVERGACLLLCLAHLLGCSGPLLCSSLFCKDQPGRGLLTGWAALLVVVGTWPHLTAHADWLVCSARLPRVLLLAGGAGKEGPSSVLRHTALLQTLTAWVLCVSVCMVCCCSGGRAQGCVAALG